MALSVKQLYEVMAQLPDPVFILSEDGYYIEYIGGVEQQSYQDGNPLAGKRLADVLPAAMTRWVMEQVTLALDSGQVQVVEYELAAVEVEGIDASVGPQGMQHFEGKIAPLPSRYDGKRAVAWVTRNITRQYELQQRLKLQSETDQLTGLYNRRYFFEHCRQRRAGEAPCALVMLDIDHFKQINDRFGHQQGDRALQRLRGCPAAGGRYVRAQRRRGVSDPAARHERAGSAGAGGADPGGRGGAAGGSGGLYRQSGHHPGTAGGGDQSGAGPRRRVALSGQAGRAQPGRSLPGGNWRSGVKPGPATLLYMTTSPAPIYQAQRVPFTA